MIKPAYGYNTMATTAKVTANLISKLTSRGEH